MLTLKQKTKKNLIFLYKSIFYRNKFDIKDTIIVTGSPRSGTTWLMEIFCVIPRYTYIFEPLNPIWSPESFEVGFSSKTYLPVDQDWPEGERHLKKIFNGDFIFLSPKQILECNKLIVKFIEINRLLPWFLKRFNTRKIFLIIRHPCAVVASQIEKGFSGYHQNYPPYKDIFPNANNILDEASKIDTLDENLINKIKKITTLEEILATSWCLDNYIPLNSPKPHNWKIIFYEKLIKDGETEIPKLFKELNEEDSINNALKHLRIPSALAIRKVDNKVIKDTTVTDINKQLPKWKKTLSDKQIERILKIVSDFGLDFYTDNMEPNYDAIK